MGFVVKDLADDQKNLFVNFWNWHPTVELIRSVGVIDAERIELLHLQLTGVSATKNEALQIAAWLNQDLLSHLQPDQHVLLDLSFISEPDDGKIHHGTNAAANYSASFEWLTKFARFCSECGGSQVL